jgi:hypothetical protein
MMPVASSTVRARASPVVYRTRRLQALDRARPVDRPIVFHLLSELCEEILALHPGGQTAEVVAPGGQGGSAFPAIGAQHGTPKTRQVERGREASRIYADHRAIVDADHGRARDLAARRRISIWRVPQGFEGLSDFMVMPGIGISLIIAS